MTNEFTQKFLEKREKFHAKHKKSEISVDWDAYTKSKEHPDETSPIAYIDTERLHLESMVSSYAQEAHKLLWGDPEVVKLYATGQTKDAEYVKNRLANWQQRWEDQNPFSGFAVNTKDGGEFFASVVLGGAAEENSAELAYLSAKKMYNKGFGKEYIGAVVFDWSSWLIEKGFKAPGDKNFLNIVDTSHVDNAASNKILQNFSFHNMYQDEKFGHIRNQYKLEVCALGDQAELDALDPQ